ncbi:MAG: hypothetical protein MI747_13040, partial [Desulfobacterales bacterium]|nr:hypothetical protein [Desulfobacterales bacterium]
LRESNYLYTPIGLRTAVNLGQGWWLENSMELDFLWYGRQESYLGYLAGYDDLEHDQNSGYGAQFILGLVRHHVSIGIGLRVFYRYWDIDTSEVVVDSNGTAWVEPANTTDEYGINLIFTF